MIPSSRRVPTRSGERADVRARLESGRLAIGEVLTLQERAFRITGFDPVSVRPRRIYVEDLASGASGELELEEE